MPLALAAAAALLLTGAGTLPALAAGEAGTAGTLVGWGYDGRGQSSR